MINQSGIHDIVVGVDLVSISRFNQLLQRFDQYLTQYVFTSYELEQCGQSIQRLAARYAAKEAVSKALQVGLVHMSKHGIPASEIEVYTQASGAPALKLYGTANELAQHMQIQALKVSLSHEKDYAIAMVTGFCLYSENQSMSVQ